MALAYSEFSTTQGNLLADLRTAILASSDWTRPNAAGFPSLYKATTTRGAVMAFNLEQAAQALHGLTIGVFRNHDGTNGTDLLTKYLYYRTSVGTMASTSPLYCTVSVSKEHIYISIEGPRPSDLGAMSTAVGSAKVYFALCDLVPYHAADTLPVVACIANPNPTPVASTGANYYVVQVSRNAANSTSWSPGKLMTLDFPSYGTNETLQSSRPCTIDGNYYLTPYVYFDDADGIRGRLSSIFFGGYNGSDSPECAPPPLGSKVTYNGVSYKLLAPNRGDGSSSNMWGPLGAGGNGGTASVLKSIVIGVPTT